MWKTQVLAQQLQQSLKSLKSQKSQKSSKKLIKLIEISPIIPNIRPTYQAVSKLADNKGEKYVVPTKRILKPATMSKPKAELVDGTKPLNLAFIGAAPFQYLIKQKDVEIFAVSIQDIKNELNAILMKDIEYQVNKTAKASTDPKIIVSEEYHEFLHVFSKEASDTLLPYLKYNH